MTPWYLDVRMLDAGDARRLHADAAPLGIPTRNPRRADASGDLDAAADRLGVDVADLVAMHRRAGIAPSHRSPSLIARLAARLRKG
jgi:hypothetical protein